MKTKNWIHQNELKKKMWIIINEWMNEWMNSLQIHARSLLPCQDSPFVKFTYSGHVKVPRPLTALMSALRTSISDNNDNNNAGNNNDDPGTYDNSGGYQTFHFEQKTSIPVWKKF